MNSDLLMTIQPRLQMILLIAEDCSILLLLNADDICYNETAYENMGKSPCDFYILPYFIL